MREPLDLNEEEQTEEDHWVRLYGPWDALDLDGARAFFDGFDRPWWLVGGWAVEMFTGVLREHEDIDASVLACDVPALREFVGDRWHLWTVGNGQLRPMTDQYPDLPEPDSQIWVRRDASSPWVMDLPVTPDADGQWRNKRLPDQIRPLDDVTWVTESGVRVLNPEIALLFKARLGRRKDHRDFAHALPLLSTEQRSWLHDAVSLIWPEHRWLADLGE